MPPRLRNDRQEASQDNVHTATQSHQGPAAQDDQSKHLEVNQENADHPFTFVLEMLQGMQQAQFELVESVRILKEAQGQGVQPPREEPNPRIQQEKGSAVGNPQSGEQNTPAHQFVTLFDLTSLLEREKGKQRKEPMRYVRKPPYPAELLSKPYPEKYETPTFALYDGRKGNAMEHISKFMDSMGPFAGDGELCLREFSKSLTNRAYTWYSTLQPNSIPTWEDMVESLCTNYFHGEEKVTIITLHNLKQKPSEGFLDFIRRFKDTALNCYGQYKEQELVEICIDNMFPEY